MKSTKRTKKEKARLARHGRQPNHAKKRNARKGISSATTAHAIPLEVMHVADI